MTTTSVWLRPIVNDVDTSDDESHPDYGEAFTHEAMARNWLFNAVGLVRKQAVADAGPPSDDDADEVSSWAFPAYRLDGERKLSRMLASANIDGDPMIMLVMRVATRRMSPTHRSIGVVPESVDGDAPQWVFTKQNPASGVASRSGLKPITSLDDAAAARGIAPVPTSMFEYARVPVSSTDGAIYGRVFNASASRCGVRVNLCSGLTPIDADATMRSLVCDEAYSLISRHKAARVMPDHGVQFSEVVVCRSEMQSIDALRMVIAFLMNAHLKCTTGCIFIARMPADVMCDETSGAASFIDERMRDGTLSLFGVPPHAIAKLRAFAAASRQQEMVAGGSRT
jgi:hypothetical protein